MGIRLVGSALSANWAHLTPRARLTLVQMAYVAKDRDPEPDQIGIYFGGQTSLAVSVLGVDPSLRGAGSKTAQRAIKRLIQELVDAGAVTLATPATGRHRAVYRVHPDIFPGAEMDADGPQ